MLWTWTLSWPTACRPRRINVQKMVRDHWSPTVHHAELLWAGAAYCSASPATNLVLSSTAWRAERGCRTGCGTLSCRHYISSTRAFTMGLRWARTEADSCTLLPLLCDCALPSAVLHGGNIHQVLWGLNRLL